MPGNVAAAAPATVMPDFVSRAFEYVSEFEVDLNYYVDGSGQAAAITSTARRTWRAEIPCDSTLLGALRTFWLARRCIEPFYFYYWRETTPLGSVDLSAVSTVGRYIVKFNGQWMEEFTLGRNSIQVELVEAL
jgi:hypothetical protein